MVAFCFSFSPEKMKSKITPSGVFCPDGMRYVGGSESLDALKIKQETIHANKTLTTVNSYDSNLTQVEANHFPALVQFPLVDGISFKNSGYIEVGYEDIQGGNDDGFDLILENNTGMQLLLYSTAETSLMKCLCSNSDSRESLKFIPVDNNGKRKFLIKWNSNSLFLPNLKSGGWQKIDKSNSPPPASDFIFPFSIVSSSLGTYFHLEKYRSWKMNESKWRLLYRRHIYNNNHWIRAKYVRVFER